MLALAVVGAAAIATQPGKVTNHQQAKVAKRSPVPSFVPEATPSPVVVPTIAPRVVPVRVIVKPSPTPTPNTWTGAGPDPKEPHEPTYMPSPSMTPSE